MTAPPRTSSEVDLLSDVLAVARVGGAVVAQAELVPPWGLCIDPLAETAVHAVLQGECWLRALEGRAPGLGTEPLVHLRTGDVVLIRAGVGHSLTDTPGTPPLPYAEALAEMPERLARHRPGRGETTRALCAKVLFDPARPHPLTRLLPPFIHLPATEAGHTPQLPLLVQLLGHEAAQAGVGSELVVPRLVDSLLVLVVRAWLDTQPLDAAGWFGALRDPAVSRALATLHARPAERWTVEALAREAGQSRATFARRFAELVGEPPMAYLTGWRLCLAAKLLRASELSVEEVAAQVGYETAAALSKAFRRAHGTAPGQYRARARLRPPLGSSAPAGAPTAPTQSDLPPRAWP